MDDAKQQLLDKLQNSNNILVTVSRNPSVDQLSSCIGLTLLLNKQGKHAAAVFSGKVPSTLEFLQPDETLEKNTDSLRDFIISLDKAKADKLRYKVEEDVVRIFITPYKTSLSEDDLQFSEGDFNVDVVVALGVKQQEDLDQAITAHGRILHDATVTSINTTQDGGLGAINWNDPQASSLSELVTDLAQALNAELLDEQIATALLTGIVSETGRFSNDKTSSQTMSASAALMSAGANQQLVANKLDSKAAKATGTAVPAAPASEENEDGVLEIDHVADEAARQAAKHEAEAAAKDAAAPADAMTDEIPLPPELLNDTPPQPPAGPAAPQAAPFSGKPDNPAASMSPGPKMITEPPKLGGTLTANSQSEQLDPVTDPFSLPSSEPPTLLDRKDDTPPPKPGPAKATGPGADVPPAPAPVPPAATLHPPTPKPPKPAPPSFKPAPVPPAGVKNGVGNSGVTLTDLEKSVGSPHVANLDSAREEVSEALSGTDSNKPIAALGAQPLGNDLHTPPTAGTSVTPTTPPIPGPADPAQKDKKDDSSTPPPVPPPIPFQFGNPPTPPQ